MGVEARDAENRLLRGELGALRAELDALRQDKRLVGLGVAELEGQLGQDSTNSGMPSSKEGIGGALG